MIYNNRINNCRKQELPYCPILALSPFTTTIVNVGEQGITGLSGNTPLISFNSGDFAFGGEFTEDVTVGLGVASSDTSSTTRSQLGVPILFQSMLSNFEIAYSGSNISGQSINYELIIMRSVSNDGVDYSVPAFIVAFSGSLSPAGLGGDFSSNELITVPINGIVFPGDRLVLHVLKFEVESSSLTVSASVHCTPF